jgi:protein SCO1/2
MTKKNSNKRFLGGLTVAVLLPLSLYLITRLMSKDKIFLPPYYGVERVEQRTENGKTVNDTLYRHVRDITLTNQLGQQVSLNNDLPGKVLVIDFFFTNCETVCPQLTTNMRLLQNAFRKTFKIEGGFDTIAQFISISTDPQRDTVAALRAYADRFKVNHDKWWFFTGDRQAIYDFARNELGVYLQPDEGVEALTHTEKIVVLDRDRHIRGYYNGMDSADVKRCADDIVLLSIEKKRKK